MFSVDNITDDAGTWTTSLAAKAVAWSEIAGSYDLTFAHTSPVPQADRLRRGLEDDATLLADALKGEVNVSRTKNFLINAGQPNERRNILNDAE